VLARTLGLSHRFLFYLLFRTTFCVLCGFDDSCILAGRPYGGYAVFWRSDIDARVEIVNTSSIHITAVKFRYISYDLIVINVYISYESNKAAADAFVDHMPAR
jgi:hypothetical protein